VAGLTQRTPQRWGIVQVVAGPGKQVDRALDLAREVAACAPLTVQAALANARMGQTDGVAAAIEHIRVDGRRIALKDARRHAVDDRSASG
jgi:enoyl-CoA hydratase